MQNGTRIAHINQPGLSIGIYRRPTKFIPEIINEKLAIERLTKKENCFFE